MSLFSAFFKERFPENVPRRLCAVLCGLFLTFIPLSSWADLASTGYVHGAVDHIVNQINSLLESDYVHADEKGAAGGVATLDDDGRIPSAQIPMGTTAGTVAAGNDARFHAIPTTMPSGLPPPGHVFIWFEE